MGFFWTLFILLILSVILLYFIQKDNLQYYTMNGRKNSEIEDWLNTRPWYNFFKFNIQQEVLNEYKNDNGEIILDKNIEEKIDNKLNEIISGKNDTLTISNAFCWKNTPEGTKYWGEREHEFLAWYFGQYVDFHLFK